MAYQTGSASGQENLLSALFTFAVANGWTQDLFDTSNNKGSLHKGNCYVHFRWDGTDGTAIALYQSLGYVGGNDPWNHTDDSGNGTTGTSLESQRRVNGIGNGTYPAYHFFAHTSPDVIWVVLEYASGLYRHFGFGTLDKKGSWTGGEFVAGHVWQPNQSDIPSSVYHSLLLDGRYVNSSNYGATYQNMAATVHAEGMPNQNGSSKWGVCGWGMLSTLPDPANDRAGNPRYWIQGGFRDGPVIEQYGWASPSLNDGFIPMMPIELFWADKDAVGGRAMYYIGKAPYVAHIQHEGIIVAQEITVGGDDWIVFPAVRKKYEQDDTEESWNMGIMYKK